MAKEKPGVMVYFEIMEYTDEFTKEQKSDLFDAILRYGKSKVEPCFTDPALKTIWKVIRPKIDKDDEAYIKKSDKAKKAAFERWNREQDNADAYERMQTHTNVCEQMLAMPTPSSPSTSSTPSPTTTSSSSSSSSTNSPVPNDKGLAEVMDYFLNKINPTAPPYVLDKIKFYYQQMGVDCCKRAFDIALAERKTSWSYINTILKNKLSQGVKCLADWEESDKKHEDGKRAKEIAKNPGKATSEDFQPKQETIKKNNDWLDKFLDENDPGWRESNKERFGP